MINAKMAITAIIEPRGFPFRLPGIVEGSGHEPGSPLQQVHNYIAYIIGWMVEKRREKTDTAVAYIQLDTIRPHIRTTVELGCTGSTALSAPATPSAA